MKDFFVSGVLKRIAPHKQRRLELANAYQRVFADFSQEGQIVLRDLCNVSGILNIDAEPLSGEEALFRAGKRAIGLHVLARLGWSETELARLGEETTYDTVMALEEEARAA